MFVNRRLDNSDPLAKISPEILQKIETVQTTIGVATSNNTPDTIVKRDGAGGFSAGTVKATSLEVSGTTKFAMPLKDSTSATILNVVNDNTHVGKDISTAGTFNTAVGTSALKGVTAEATLNTAVGVRSLEGLTTGTHNVAIGYRTGGTGTALTTGTKCTLIGADARTSSSTMENSIAIGFTAVVDANNTIQLGNNGIVAVKTSGTLYAAGLESAGATPTILNIASLNNTSTLNIGSGSSVQTINIGNNGAGVTTIKLGAATDFVDLLSTVTADGVKLMTNSTTNITLGRLAGNLLTTGTSTTAIGAGALSKVTTGSVGHTALGYNAGSNIVGGNQNTIIGHESGSIGSATYSFSTGVGSQVLKNCAATGNSALGCGALLTASTGGENTATGWNAGNKVTTGANNSFIGANAGANNLSVTTGSNNTLIGALTETATTNQTNATALGYGAKVDENNCIQLGNTSVTAVKTSGTITAGGLKLPTTGGTAGTLNYYEEYTYQTKFTGAISETANITISMVRVGKMVTLSLKANGNSADGVAAFTGPLSSMTNFPARFYPDTVEDTVFIIPTREGSSALAVGRLRIPANTGMLYITRQDDGDFISGQTYGFEAFSISWTLS